jgi:F-type H+-transporting ATPase subunit delta
LFFFKNKKQILEITLKSYLDIKTFNFLNFLINRNRINLIIKIIQKYLDLVYKLIKFKTIKVYSAFNFKKEQKKKLIEIFKKVTTSYEVQIIIIINSNFINGFIIKIDSKVYDFTIKQKLNKLINYFYD